MRAFPFLRVVKAEVSSLRDCLHDTGSSSIRNEKQNFVPCLHESVYERTHTERGLTK